MKVAFYLQSAPEVLTVEINEEEKILLQEISVLHLEYIANQKSEEALVIVKQRIRNEKLFNLRQKFKESIISRGIVPSDRHILNYGWETEDFIIDSNNSPVKA